MKSISYKTAIATVIRISLIAMIISVLAIQAQIEPLAATQKTSVSERELAAGLQFYFNNMPYSGSNSPISTYKGKSLSFSGIQNFDFTPDGKYIFTSSKCFTGSDMHTMITRCSLPDPYDAEEYAECREAFVLGGYGHGEVLAITQDDPDIEEYDLWVGCDPENSNGGHATAIARLTYKVGADGSGSITKTVKINGFKKANTKKGKAAYFKDKVSPMWVIAAVDEDSNQIVFRLRFKEGYGCWFLSYDLGKIDAALDALDDNGTYKIQKAAKWQKARIRYSKSIQAFDVDGKKLYITDGAKGGKAMVYVLPYKTQSSKKVKDQKKTDKDLSKSISITPAITIDGVRYGRDEVEIEGIKVGRDADGNTVCFINFLRAGTGLRNTQTLHMISK